MLQPQMPSFLQETEGAMVPADMPLIIDSHVHVFPPNVFSAVWKWFDKNAWEIRYRMETSQIFDFLLSHGVKHIIALQYAHKPAIARQLNRYLIETMGAFAGSVSGMATVFPSEDGAADILQEAFDSGLKGVKLHAHVQGFEMNADYMDCLYDCCQRNRKPMIMHVGRQPKSDAYCCDLNELCCAAKLERVLRSFPGLKICVPHLGFDEFTEYRELTEKYDNLWLDTTMVMTDYFPAPKGFDLSLYRRDRVMYGSDFPNIPFAWDRELKALRNLNLSYDFLNKITCANAIEFFALQI